jgi:L-ascorbate metabolism protein UlaG (beta-lactamase superfamily)
MKVTKLVHSCLLIEENGVKILIDPGVYSWQDEGVNAADLSGISAVVITHNHPDHLNDDFAAAINVASPDATWYGTAQAASQLQNLGIACSIESRDENIQFIASAHADLSPWFPEQPEHTSYLLCNTLLVSGDCQSLTSSHGARILAGAINGGPWGAVVGFSKMIEAMDDRPEIVLPLHDWHWNEEARAGIYARLPEVMKSLGATFIPLENTIEQEI